METGLSGNRLIHPHLASSGAFACARASAAHSGAGISTAHAPAATPSAHAGGDAGVRMESAESANDV